LASRRGQLGESPGRLGIEHGLGAEVRHGRLHAGDLTGELGGHRPETLVLLTKGVGVDSERADVGQRAPARAEANQDGKGKNESYRR
jgi:hypothetical protein